MTVPAGWTALYNQAGGGNLRVCAGIYKVASGSEGASVTVTWSRAVTIAAVAFQVSGYTGTPVDGTLATGSSTAPNPPSLTSGFGSVDTLWLAIAGDMGGSLPSAIPANYSSVGTSTGTGPNPESYLAVASRNLNASSEDPGTFTISSAQWGANTVAIQGVAVASGDGSSSGSGAATGVGASRFAAAASSSGAATGSGTGASRSAAVASSSGAGTASSIGASTAASEGDGSGAGIGTGLGESTFEAVGTSSGSSTVDGVGFIDSIGEASGVASVAGVGAAISHAAGNAVGVASATGEGAQIRAAVAETNGNATASATAIWIAAAKAEAYGTSAGAFTGVNTSTSGSFAPEQTRRSPKKSKKERERLLDHALAKAFDPKRSTLVDRTPWLIEPVPDAILIDRPEFNPRLAALHGEAQQIQAQLAQIQFNRSQEEDDIELLLMAL